MRIFTPCYFSSFFSNQYSEKWAKRLDKVWHFLWISHQNVHKFLLTPIIFFFFSKSISHTFSPAHVLPLFVQHTFFTNLLIKVLASMDNFYFFWLNPISILLKTITCCSFHTLFTLGSLPCTRSTFLPNLFIFGVAVNVHRIFFKIIFPLQ